MRKAAVKKKILILSVLMMGMWIAGVSEARASEVEVLNLPEGEEERGRQAFQDLKCSSCHAIAGDPELKDPVASKPAPVLGLKQSSYKTRFLAQSIIDPSHAIAPGFKEKENPLQSRMGDFTETMTVRQLSDLVAYLRSRDEEV